jgi:hypothetical protein
MNNFDEAKPRERVKESVHIPSQPAQRQPNRNPPKAPKSKLGSLFGD